MPPTQRSKKTIAYEALKKRIINNSLKPGDPLNERVISEELRISKTPIREALQQLEQDGFVDSILHKGSFVSRISVQDIREIFEVREILECAAAKGSAFKGGHDKLEAMKRRLESIERVNGKTPLNLLKAGDQIHNYLFESFGNNRLTETYRRLQDHIDRLRMHFVTQFDRNRLEHSSKEHREILDALLARDPVAAEKAVKTHLRNAQDNIKRLI
jgi:DNA-binding GntR family transcriptional regulator